MQGIRFEGENFDIRKSNAIWGFTPGDLSKGGWLSEKAPNLETLTQASGDFDWALKHSAKNKMTIAVPNWVKNLVYKKGTSFETFLIHFFDSTATSVNQTPMKTITFHKVLILDNIPRDLSKIPNMAASSFQQILMEIKNGVDFPKA